MSAERPIDGVVWNRVTTRRGTNRMGQEVVEITFHYDDAHFPTSSVIVVPANEKNVWMPLNDARPSFA